MTSPIAVRDKAIRLQNEARRLETGAQDEGQANRIARRVEEVEGALARLSGHARAARALLKHTTTAITLTDLTAGRDDLARRAADSLPGDPAFIAARRKIEARASVLEAEVQAGWKIWTDEQLSILPISRIAMLDITQQGLARTTLKRVRSLAGVTAVTAADISQFVTAYEGLKEELAEAGDVPEVLLGLMERLSGTAVTLRAVSDEEIALLRQYEMDGEIELRRKSG